MIEPLLDDGPLLVVAKPGGLATQAPPQFPSLERNVKEWIRARTGKTGNVYLGVPHRLDRVASGVIAFARNSKAAARLAEQFQKRQAKKIYWAVLESAPPEAEGRLVDFIRKIPGEARAEICLADAPDAREAILDYRVLQSVTLATVIGTTAERTTSGTSAGATSTSASPLTTPSQEGRAAVLVEIELHTGRMHQIRCQFAARGCPIVGDVKYGATTAASAVNSADPAPDPAVEPGERILLHARQLTLFHPIRYDTVTILAPTPDDWPAHC